MIFKEIAGEQLRHQLSYTAVENLLIVIKSIYMAFIGSPTHPFGLGWQFPFVRIEIGNQFGLNLCRDGRDCPDQGIATCKQLGAPILAGIESAWLLVASIKPNSNGPQPGRRNTTDGRQIF